MTWLPMLNVDINGEDLCSGFTVMSSVAQVLWVSKEVGKWIVFELL